MKRRTFIKKTAVIAGITTLSGVVFKEVLGRDGNYYFRPPGALNETEFLAACIRCGKCIQKCPYKSLKTGTISDGIAIGTPYFDLRETPCYLCEDMPCIKSCPTDALNHELPNIYESHIGKAVITDRENCLSLNGLRCEICYRVCPLIDKAIVLRKTEHPITRKHTIFEPVVNAESCTGCGICEHSCPLDISAIDVLPLTELDKSKHYKTLKEQKVED